MLNLVWAVRRWVRNFWVGVSLIWFLFSTTQRKYGDYYSVLQSINERVAPIIAKNEKSRDRSDRDRERSDRKKDSDKEKDKKPRDDDKTKDSKDSTVDVKKEALTEVTAPVKDETVTAEPTKVEKDLI